MHQVNLDYQSGHRQTGPLQWGLVALALVFAIYVATTYFNAENKLTSAILELNRITDLQHSSKQSKTVKTTPDDLAHAHKVIARLTVPWSDFFRALEGIEAASIALLSITPDPSSGEVSITGESEDYASLLNYVEQLKDLDVVSRAYLVRHEVRVNEPQRPIAFTINAKWRHHGKA